jgi:DNA-binding MarR family transcriptional regulator
MEEQKRFARALLNLDRGLEHVARRCSRSCDLTPEQSRALQFVAEKGEVAVGALGALLGVAKSTASKNLTKLQVMGLVERHKGDSDGRETRVRLTTNGRTTAKMLGADLFNSFGTLMGGIPREHRKRLILALEEIALVVGPSVR